MAQPPTIAIAERPQSAIERILRQQEGGKRQITVSIVGPEDEWIADVRGLLTVDDTNDKPFTVSAYWPKGGGRVRFSGRQVSKLREYKNGYVVIVDATI